MVTILRLRSRTGKKTIRELLAQKLRRYDQAEFVFGDDDRSGVFSPDSRYVAIVRQTKNSTEFEFYDLETDTEVASFKHVGVSWTYWWESLNRTRMLFTSQVESGSQSPQVFTVLLWDWEKMGPVPIPERPVQLMWNLGLGFSARRRSFVLDATGKYCLVENDRLIGLWDLEAGEALGRARIHGQIRTYAFAPDGSSVAVVLENDRNRDLLYTQLFALPEMTPLDKFVGYSLTDYYTTLDIFHLYSNDSKMLRLYSSSDNPRSNGFKMNKKPVEMDAFTKETITEEQHKTGFTPIVYRTPHPRWADSDEEGLRIRRKPTPNVVPVPDIVEPCAVDVLEDGNLFAVSPNQVVLFDRTFRRVGQQIREDGTPEYTTGSIDQSGSHAIIALSDGTVAFQQPRTAGWVHDPALVIGETRAVAHCGSSPIAVTVGLDDEAPVCRIWNTETHQQIGKPINLKTVPAAVKAMKVDVVNLAGRRQVGVALAKIFHVDMNASLLRISGGAETQLIDLTTGERIAVDVVPELLKQPFDELAWNGRFVRNKDQYEWTHEDGMACFLDESSEGQLQLTSWRRWITGNTEQVRLRVEVATASKLLIKEPGDSDGVIVDPLNEEEWRLKVGRLKALSQVPDFPAVEVP